MRSRHRPRRFSHTRSASELRAARRIARARIQNLSDDQGFNFGKGTKGSGCRGVPRDCCRRNEGCLGVSRAVPVAPPDYRVVASRNSKDAERKLQAAGAEGLQIAAVLE